MLVGFETSDDAGVYRLNAETALVQTVDFFTPMVDDPYAFGAIAAANALSDVYAMGGVPRTALNVVGYPIGQMPLEILEAILEGGLDKAREAGVTIVGGHTVDDAEPKYGMAVTGTVHPERVLRNCDARPGDRLLLTKPIGVGILTTALKRDLATPEQIDEATRSMMALNKDASAAMIAVGAHACTDITGYGLLGHLHEMLKGSNMAARIRMEDVPTFPAALAFAEADVVPGGSRNNLRYIEPCVRFSEKVTPAERLLLADAQTSGGLLMAVPADKAAHMAQELGARGVLAAEIGEILAPSPGREAGSIEVVR